MTSNLGKSVVIKDGKIKRIHRVAAGQRKAKHAKAHREVKAWVKKGHK